MLDLIAYLVAGMMAWFIWRQSPGLTPAFVMVGSFDVVFGVRSLGLLEIPGISSGALLVFSVGLLLVTLGHVLTCGPRFSAPYRYRTDASHDALRGWPFVAVALFVLMVSLLGWYSYRSAVAGFYGTTDFGELSINQVRAADGAPSVESAIGGLTILTSAYPVLAFIGILGMRFRSRFWIILAVIAFVLSLSLANRASIISVLATCLIAWVLTARRRPNLSVGFAALSGFLAVSYRVFNSIGQALFKNRFDQVVESHVIPPEAVTILIYLTGKPSAFSVAYGSGIDPLVGNHGRSIYLFIWLASRLNVIAGDPPNTFAIQGSTYRRRSTSTRESKIYSLMGAC